VPLEGQAGRVVAPLRRRDRLVLAVAAAASAVAAAVAGSIYLTRSHAHGNRHCVTVVIPSTMGGAAQTSCRPK